ncbi:MAG: stage III sporulation protein AC [Ruminococcus sp.]|mgnify:FL=1|jgi:stage III sporulation protein AC|nr:stage III sporulation protein AC [Oscillospiraceae bacterium]MCI6388778.1 stage III sporulation protein AC [Ruminococcus sp.]MDY4909420.1 stage III sporulation protein AC [Candidatus Fimenecus sp.]MDD6271856.1 stage III sporulation protein AC [Ruminococcus sp.]MDD7345317.1 stage III sporulation protein AC [Ruminococcus sp.]
MEIGFILKIAGIGIIVAVLNQVLVKTGRDDYAMLTVIAGIIVAILMLIPQMTSLVSTVKSVFDF